MKKSFCRRCLLSELDKTDYFNSIYQYIESLAPEFKTESGEYERRLSICKNCDSLINGMCIKCGCFVEVRAVKAVQHCPNTPTRW